MDERSDLHNKPNSAQPRRKIGQTQHTMKPSPAARPSFPRAPARSCGSARSATTAFVIVKLCESSAGGMSAIHSPTMVVDRPRITKLRAPTEDKGLSTCDLSKTNIAPMKYRPNIRSPIQSAALSDLIKLQQVEHQSGQGTMTSKSYYHSRPARNPILLSVFVDTAE